METGHLVISLFMIHSMFILFLVNANERMELEFLKTEVEKLKGLIGVINISCLMLL